MANVIHNQGSFNPHSVEVYASAARTTTPDTHEYEVGGTYESVTLVVKTTAAGTSPSTVFKLSAVDRVTGELFAELSTAAVTGTGTVTLRISPHLTASANAISKDVVHPILRVTSTHGNATSHTYQAGLIFA